MLNAPKAKPLNAANLHSRRQASEVLDITPDRSLAFLSNVPKPFTNQQQWFVYLKLLMERFPDAAYGQIHKLDTEENRLYITAVEWQRENQGKIDQESKENDSEQGNSDDEKDREEGYSPFQEYLGWEEDPRRDPHYEPPFQVPAMSKERGSSPRQDKLSRRFE